MNAKSEILGLNEKVLFARLTKKVELLVTLVSVIGNNKGDRIKPYIPQSTKITLVNK